LTRYLLDTDVVISFSKKREPAYSWMLGRIHSSDELGVCGIVVAEFFAGLPPDDRPAWESFFDAMTYWETSPGAARRAGRYRYRYARQGLAIATSDALIAAISLDVQATLVTGNVRQYPVPDITLLPL
jgi:tRNA(fMet)-specific endonuclease VapC